MKGLFRARVGNYRVVFTLAAGTITVVQITGRKETY
jgi:mRNA-degrading endonuclease RelE of RelBE toxin-antitoxin system